MLISLCPVAALKHSPSKRKSVKIKPGGAGVTVPGVPGGQSSKTGSGDAGGGQDRSSAPPNNEGKYTGSPKKWFFLTGLQW